MTDVIFFHTGVDPGSRESMGKRTRARREQMLAFVPASCFRSDQEMVWRVICLDSCSSFVGSKLVALVKEKKKYVEKKRKRNKE